MNSRDGAAPTNDLNSENAADAGSVNLSNRFNVLCTDYRFSFQFLFLHVFDVDCWLTMRQTRDWYFGIRTKRELYNVRMFIGGNEISISTYLVHYSLAEYPPPKFLVQQEVSEVGKIVPPSKLGQIVPQSKQG